jgi:hypothetical protein
MGQAEDPPPGFEAYAEPSGFLERIGPLLQRRTGDAVLFGVRIAEHHCNRRGMAHGGLIVALADIALGKTGEWLSRPPVSLLTASLTVDFGWRREPMSRVSAVRSLSVIAICASAKTSSRARVAYSMSAIARR